MPAPRTTLIALLALVAGCSLGRSEGAALPEDAAARAQEIARLEARVTQDRAALEDYVAAPRSPDAAPFQDDPSLRAIAERLNADTARLELLRGDAPARGTE